MLISDYESILVIICPVTPINADRFLTVIEQLYSEELLSTGRYNHLADSNLIAKFGNINRLGQRAKSWIGVMEYVENSHVISVTNYRLRYLYTLT